MFDNMEPVDLDKDTTVAIAIGMKEMAEVDDELHQNERVLIEGFLAELGEVDGQSVDFSLLSDPSVQDLFFRSLAMVALADGEIKQAEIDLLQAYIDRLGAKKTAQSVIGEVGRRMLSRFAGVTVFREQAVALGRGLGLDESDIAEVLDS
jgi:hypothetical protein